MLVITRQGVTPEQLDAVVAAIEEAGLRAHVSRGDERVIVGCLGDDAQVPVARLDRMAWVEQVVPVQKPWRLASRDYAAGATRVPLGDARGTVVGGEELIVIAGPCSVEGAEMITDIAHTVQAAGARALRGGAFKPRSSPWAFQGLGQEGLQQLAAARRATGLPVVTEVLDTRQVELVAEHADVLQIGARNMQNTALLTEVGRTQRPVLLKRGLSATIAELLLAAEYIMAQGNTRVMLCERGIRTYETATRNTLDVAAIPVLKRETHLPVLVDPSHAAGKAALVLPLALAAVAAGADGLLVEVHADPANAWSDGEQSLTPAAFAELMAAIAPIAVARGRTLAAPQTLAAA